MMSMLGAVSRAARLLRRASRVGLDGKAYKELAASGNVGVLRDLDSRREVRQLEAALASRNKVANTVGATAGAAVLGALVDTHAQNLRRTDRRWSG